MHFNSLIYVYKVYKIWSFIKYKYQRTGFFILQKCDITFVLYGI